MIYMKYNSAFCFQMHIPTSFWVCTVAVLAVHSLGIVACLTLPVIIAAFIAGLVGI
jgi:hypothetical protein